jgi:lactoylglutathione lyase/glyoxylase I family protein
MHWEERMPIKVKQVAHVCIFARDLGATRDFYGDVLGLPIKFNFKRNGRWHGFYLDAGGRTNIEVFENPEWSYGPENQINHLCLEVEDIDAAVAHVRDRGVEITNKKFGCDDTWQAWVTDPNGVRIELFQYTDKSAQFVGGDRVANW